MQYEMWAKRGGPENGRDSKWIVFWRDGEGNSKAQVVTCRLRCDAIWQVQETLRRGERQLAR